MTPPINGSAHKTLLVGLLFLTVAAIGYLMLRYSIAHMSGTPIPGDPGPFFLPSICLTVVGVAGATLFGLGIWRLIQTKESLMPPIQFGDAARDMGLTVGFVAALLLMPTAIVAFGTFRVVAVFSIFWIYAFLAAGHGHSIRNLVEAVLLGFGTALFINIVFLWLLKLPLPT